VAHEINTPLGVAVTAASLVSEAVRNVDELVKAGRLRRSDLDRLVTEAGEALEVLQVNVRRAAELVRQFKDVAVDQAGSGVRRIELGAYVEESLVALRPLLKGSRVTVRVERPEPVEIETRPGVVSQLVTNFVQNALTHAFAPGQPGQVVLRVGREGDQALLVVSDDGAGMPPEVAAHAFEPFFTTRRGRGGSGLGLFVVHNLVVDALRGSIELESSPGHGTTFRVRIPLDLPAGEPGGFMPHAGSTT
jgi:two-component system NtrC family sensor kinase